MKAWGTRKMLSLAAGLLLSLLAMTTAAFAATANPSTGSAGYFMMVFHFDSQLTSVMADKAAWKMPWPVELIDIKCSARTLGGTASPTYTWTLQAGATNNATCSPTANATEAQGTIATSTIADEAAMTLDWNSTGTTPTADDSTVILIFKRQ
jgi:hypothetical protein